MIREIKFRAISESRLMVYGNLINHGYYAEVNHDLIGCGIQLKSGYTERIPDNKTVGQFTGLKDKNGKEIYEGDICDFLFSPESNGYLGSYPNSYKCKAQVVFEDGCFKLINLIKSNKNSRNWRSKIFISSGISQIEIIGNIHENPESL